MVMMAANYLDPETVLRKLSFINVDEIESILARNTQTDAERNVLTDLDSNP